jgi:hypothetical protein
MKHIILILQSAFWCSLIAIPTAIHDNTYNRTQKIEQMRNLIGKNTRETWQEARPTKYMLVMQVQHETERDEWR